MMYQLTMQEVTYQEYPIQEFSSPSTSIEEIDIRDLQVNMLFYLIRERLKKPFYPSLISLFETDLIPR